MFKSIFNFLAKNPYRFPSGTEMWHRFGELHREDGPAVIQTDGTQVWYQNGKLHRNDGPAVIMSDGTQVWYQNGELHREDGPAIIREDGSQEWYQNGKRHREDGPAVIREDGAKIWYRNGERHRDYGPAAIRPDGMQQWHKFGILHREDGPAITRPDGTKEWYLYGKRFYYEDDPKNTDIFKDIDKFAIACDQPPSESNYKMYIDLIREEFNELQEAVENDDKLEQLDALIDIMVVTAGAIRAGNMDGPGAWKEVMDTNFAKIDPTTGKVNKREDGKVLKPEGWQPPNLKPFLG